MHCDTLPRYANRGLVPLAWVMAMRLGLGDPLHISDVHLGSVCDGLYGKAIAQRLLDCLWQAKLQTLCDSARPGRHLLVNVTARPHSGVSRSW